MFDVWRRCTKVMGSIFYHTILDEWYSEWDDSNKSRCICNEIIGNLPEEDDWTLLIHDPDKYYYFDMNWHVISEHLFRDWLKRKFIIDKISKSQSIDYNIACIIVDLL